MLSLARLEALRVRADEAHARLAAYLDVRPARTVEVQWLVRRAFCRGLGEPEVDGLHEPQALVFERNGQAMLAPLEADVLRWSDGYIDHHGRRLRVESELGVSWQAQLVVGALPERGVFPSAQLALLSAIPDGLPFPVDLSLNARFLPNGTAVRLVRRRIQDADQILRAEDDGDQGASDQGYERTQAARDLLGYLQSASHPPLLRASLAVAVAAADPDELERRVAACRRAFGEIALHRPLGEQLELFCQHLPGQPSRARGYEDTLTVEQVAAMMPTAGHPIGSASGPYLGHTLQRRALPGALRPARGLAQRPPDDGAGRRLAGLGQDDPHPGAALPRLPGRRADRRHRPQGRSPLPPPRRGRAARRDHRPAPRAERCAGLLDPLRVAPEHLRHDAAVSFLSDLLPARADTGWLTAIVRAVDAVVRTSRVADVRRGRARPRPGRRRRRAGRAHARASTRARGSRSSASPAPTRRCPRSAPARSPTSRCATCPPPSPGRRAPTTRRPSASPSRSCACSRSSPCT